ncbi:MAG: hypothetical protein RR426_07130 [Oscillospiraceae bacterium]
MSRRTTLDQRIETQNKKKNLPREDPDEEMDLELERERNFLLNRQKSIFDQAAGKREDGINTAPSIFDKTAVFHTQP